MPTLDEKLRPKITSKSEFYWECTKRAFRGKLAQVELVSGLLALVAVPIGLWLWPNASGAMNWVPLAIFGAFFVGTIAVGLITAPYWMFGELEQQRNELQAILDTRAARRSAIAKLWELRATGVEHRNKNIERDDVAQWVRTFDVWREDVLAHAGTVSDGLNAWLTTLDRVRPPPDLAPPASADHKHYRGIMSEILLRMEEFLQAEMLNKDIASVER